MIGRDLEMTALKTNLLRHCKPGVVLIGQTGVGKTALVEKLAVKSPKTATCLPASEIRRSTTFP